MSFKEFFSHQDISQLDEKETPVGDAMEGVFAIAIALYIADGKVDKDKLINIVRTTELRGPTEIVIDSNIADDGWIAQKLPNVKPGNKIMTKVFLKLKKTAGSIFGPKATKYAAIEKSLTYLPTVLAKSDSIQLINQFVVKILTDNKPDHVVFHIIADGMTTASSRDEIKGDVSVQISAITDTLTPNIPPIVYSIKTDNRHLSGRSIFNALLHFSKSFNLPMGQGLENMAVFPKLIGATIWELEKNPMSKQPDHLLYYAMQYLKLSTASTQNSEKMQGVLNNLVNRAIKEMESQIKEKNIDEVTKSAFRFIRREALGTQAHSVLKIVDDKFYELTDAHLEYLAKKYKIAFNYDKDNRMYFYAVDRQTNNNDGLLFTINPSYKISDGEKKLIIEVDAGKLLYKLVA